MNARRAGAVAASVRRTIKPFAEILVVRRSVGRRDPQAGIPRAVRARALEVAPDGVRFNYRLVGEADPAGINGWRAFANEGVTWAASWDAEIEGALLAAHALADHPRPVRDSPRTRD